MSNNIFNNIVNEEKTKINNKIKYTKSKYKCIFHLSISKNDCINSIDIINDKVVIGTIMGDVNLCRVDENNLLIKNQEKNVDINEDNNILKLNEEDNKKKEISCIQLKANTKKNSPRLGHINEFSETKINLKSFINNKKNKGRNVEDESQTFDNTNDKTNEKTRNKKIKLIKLNNKSNGSTKEYLKPNKSENINKINIRKIRIKDNEKKENISIRYNDTNVENNDGNDKNSLASQEEKTSIEDMYNHPKKIINNNIKKFPQVTKLIDKSTENIPCLEFDTEDKINISIGDFEIISMENIKNFNINDKNSFYNYLKIKNYKSESQHLKHCENSTCMMNSQNFLLIFTKFAEYDSELKFFNCKYNNRNLNTCETIGGRLSMSNFSIPFDFDGDRFLFLEYISKNERRICIFYTLSDKDKYEYNIENDFGHISHMKIISKDDNKIFLCRNDNQCEIHLINENFTCIESWKHIGNDIISSFIYIKESKITEEFKSKIKSQKEKINNNYDNYIITNNNKGTILKKNKYNKSNQKNIILNQIEGASSIINININPNLSFNNKKGNINFLNYEYNNTENIETNPKNKNMKNSLNNDNSSKKEFNNSEKKLRKENVNGVDIYKKKFNEDSFTQKNQNYSDKSNDKSIIKTENDNNEKNVDTVEEDENYNKSKNYIIITLDKNGNVNLYQNKKVKTIFNLYEIENIDEIYKKEEFFATGFPYYIVMNEIYVAITTDNGLFVISKIVE